MCGKNIYDNVTQVAKHSIGGTFCVTICETSDTYGYLSQIWGRLDSNFQAFSIVDM